MLPIAQFESQLRSEGAAKKTIQFYVTPVRKFSEHCRKPLDQVTTEDVYSFRDSVTSSDYAKHNAIRAVKFFLKRNGIKLEIKLPSFVPPAPDEYQPHQLKQLFAAADEKEHRLFMFFLCTGCREGEVQHAMWENLTQDSYTVRSVEGWRPKKNKTRTIPIPDSLSSLLEPVRGSGLIFPNIHSRPDGHFLKKLCHLAKRSGQCPEDFQLQKFRRTFATTHLRNGATIHELMGWMGWSDMNVAMRYLALANTKSERVRSLANSAFATMGGV